MITIGRLAKLTGIERRRLRRQLNGGRVPVMRNGSRWVVYRLALRREMPAFYKRLLGRLQRTTDR